MNFNNEDPIKEKGKFWSDYGNVDPIEEYGKRKHEGFGVNTEYRDNNRDTNDYYRKKSKEVTVSSNEMLKKYFVWIISASVVIILNFFDNGDLFVRKYFKK